MKKTLTIIMLMITIGLSAQTWKTVGPVLYTDPDVGQHHDFSITAGNTLKYFKVDASGVISVKTAVFRTFTTTKTMNLTVKITDDGMTTKNGQVVQGEKYWDKCYIKVILSKGTNPQGKKIYSTRMEQYAEKR